MRRQMSSIGGDDALPAWYLRGSLSREFAKQGAIKGLRLGKEGFPNGLQILEARVMVVDFYRDFQ